MADSCPYMRPVPKTGLDSISLGLAPSRVGVACSIRSRVLSWKYLAIQGGCRVPDPTPGASHSVQVRSGDLTLTETGADAPTCPAIGCLDLASTAKVC